MHVFRLFGVCVLIPLISVGLCAQGSPKVGRGNIAHRKDHTRHLSSLLSKNGTQPVTFPEVNTVPENATTSSRGTSGPSSISPRSLSTSDSLPNHPHPLYLNVHITKPISNSTQTDDFLQSNFQGEGRGVVLEILNLSWISSLLWKAVTSYAIVSLINLLLAPLVKKFGIGGPYWETSINLGNHEDYSLFKFGPNLKKFRLSFGNSQGSNSKDDKEESEHDHHGGHGHGGHGGHGGWGWPQPHHQPGHVGYNPNVGPGWLSYDQAAMALPMLDKYSIKAAKKAQKFKKKAQKYAQKASHYAAKAQAAQLSIKPLYANGFIHPGAATIPGVPAYGWGK